MVHGPQLRERVLEELVALDQAALHERGRVHLPEGVVRAGGRLPRGRPPPALGGHDGCCCLCARRRSVEGGGWCRLGRPAARRFDLGWGDLDRGGSRRGRAGKNPVCVGGVTGWLMRRACWGAVCVCWVQRSPSLTPAVVLRRLRSEPLRRRCSSIPAPETKTRPRGPNPFPIDRFPVYSVLTTIECRSIQPPESIHPN